MHVGDDHVCRFRLFRPPSDHEASASSEPLSLPAGEFNSPLLQADVLARRLPDAAGQPDSPDYREISHLLIELLESVTLL